jgi:hypothetical protein
MHGPPPPYNKLRFSRHFSHTYWTLKPFSCARPLTAYKAKSIAVLAHAMSTALSYPYKAKLMWVKAAAILTFVFGSSGSESLYFSASCSVYAHKESSSYANFKSMKHLLSPFSLFLTIDKIFLSPFLDDLFSLAHRMHSSRSVSDTSEVDFSVTRFSLVWPFLFHTCSRQPYTSSL